MRLVAPRDVKQHIVDHGGALFVWAKATRCCGGRQYVLEASLERPAGTFERVHAVDGFQVFAPPGLAQPDELHLDLDRRGRVHAYWNNQAWIG